MTGTKCEVVEEVTKNIYNEKFCKMVCICMWDNRGTFYSGEPQTPYVRAIWTTRAARYLTLAIPTIWFCKWLYTSEEVQYIYLWCSSFTDASMKVRFSGKWGKSPLSFDWWHWFIVILLNLIKFRFHIIVPYQT